MDMFCKFKSKKMYNVDPARQKQCCECAYTIKMNLLLNSNETFRQHPPGGGAIVNKTGEKHYERAHKYVAIS